jgi:LmbE family N-acetylglucosaminyl deacetylase
MTPGDHNRPDAASKKRNFSLPDERQKRVLVLAPHPDDETFGCGGTVCMLTESGVAVDVAFMTRGELGQEAGIAASLEVRAETAECRTQEARRACQVLGVREVLFLAGADSRLADQPQLAASIAGLLQRGGYQRVFCPWQHDSHDDHRATFALLRAAVGSQPTPLQFWLYEVWKPLPANTFVPIDRTLQTKRRAIDQYESQLAQLNYRDAFLGLASYRSLFCPSSKYAEAFLVCDHRELLSLS